MINYLVDASIMIKVKGIPISMDCPPELGHTIEHAVARRLNMAMTILDIKGSRSAEDGTIETIEPMNVEIDNVSD